jgi:hypothetical protein
MAVAAQHSLRLEDAVFRQAGVLRNSATRGKSLAYWPE